MKRSRARSEESIEFARNQRRTANEFASTVWQWIRNRQIHGAKFRREYPMPPYTADFCCVELKLIIEIDGEGHFTEQGVARDLKRDQFLLSQGYKILRIPGYSVIQEEGDVMSKIREFVKNAGPSPPAPLPFVPQGRGEKEKHDRIDEEMVAVLANKTEAERLRMAWGMWRSARKMIERIVVSEYRDLSADEQNRMVSRRMSHGT
ncbi:MAG TPA: endonuclease domain-containing protein [Pirellulaceae bacterium]|nr:endonuclease domain-containing protein [Pirellulaceae bacterium]HMO94339.1 endonuclease domain-containing protein [Pirellulaceae bacterium]HMP69648.1 endonuclease domain-containing protein [Pirellulaceae bacterium]